MDTIFIVLALVALVLAAIDEFQAQFRSLTTWAVILLSLVILLGLLNFHL